MLCIAGAKTFISIQPEERRRTRLKIDTWDGRKGSARPSTPARYFLLYYFTFMLLRIKGSPGAIPFCLHRTQYRVSQWIPG